MISIMDGVAILGAAAWTPQIISWGYRFFTQPKITIHLYPQTEIGYTSFGPIFNVRFALLSENKDAILNRFSVNIRHERGSSHTFVWAGLSEDLSEIENPLGTSLSIKKSSLPLVVRVIHTGVAQVFVRFQYEPFKAKYKGVLAPAIERFQYLKHAGKINSVQDVDDLTSEKDFADIVKVLHSEFIWVAGKYTVTFDFQSPNKFSYKKDEYSFTLSQDDIDELKKNIEYIKLDLIQNTKQVVAMDFKPENINWVWRNPDLQVLHK